MATTRLQQALASLSHEEAMVVWHALAAYTENGREEPEACPDLGLAESALSMLEVAVAEPMCGANTVSYGVTIVCSLPSHHRGDHNTAEDGTGDTFPNHEAGI